MSLIWKKPARFFIKNKFIYLGLMFFWIAITCGQITWGVLPSWFWIRPILQSKILLVAIVFTGRNLFFPQHRYQRIFGSIFFAILALGVTLNFLGQQHVYPWQGNCLIILDDVIWSLLAALTGEVIIALFKYWYSFNLVEPVKWARLHKIISQETSLLGIWLALILGCVYYYLINCYLLDALWYSRFLAGLLCLTGFVLQGIYIVRRQALIDQELMAIDCKLQSYLNWRIEPKGEQLKFFDKFHWLLEIRSYWQSLRRFQIPLGCLLLYGFLAIVLLTLPYIFKMVIEV